MFNTFLLRTLIMKRLLAAILITATFVSVSGCSTLADAKAAKGTGTVRVYDKPYDVVWDAVVASVKASGLALVSDSKSDGTILAQGAMGAFSYGENVAVFVEDAGGKVKTRVEIVNKRALATNITAADWEGRLSSAIDQRMKSLPQ